MSIQSRLMIVLAIALTTLGLFPLSTSAGTVYSDNFDSGTSLYTASPYFVDQGQYNGLITKSTATAGGGYYGNDIPADVGGSGYFLFNGTATVDIPGGQNAFYVSPMFAVTPNTDYVLSFYLTNADTKVPAQIQAQISGVTIDGPVSAIGTYATDGWQQFTFSFTSGALTSETITLNDLTTTWNGNDFGVDDIRVATAVPEPSSLMMCAISFLSLLIVTASMNRTSRR